MYIELKKLELTNYRNIKHAIYEFDGNSKIVGENRIGKTNTLEAIVWLLTDKLLNGSTDISSIKPTDDTKAEVRVEGEFKVGEKTVTIRKEYGEDWVKTRGTDELIFKGHYLTYYYNGVKQKTQRDFYELFYEDFDLKVVAGNRQVDAIQMLVNPFYMGDMGESDKWKDMRAFIISLIGDVSDSDVFAKNESLRPLEYDLSQRGGRIDELKKYYQGNIKTLEEQIIGDDAQIKMLEETPCPTEQELAIAIKGVQELDEDIAKLQSEKTSDSLLVEFDKQINALESEINELAKKDIENSKNDALSSELANLNAKYHDLLATKAELIGRRSTLIGQAESTKNLIEYCNGKRQGFLDELKRIDEQINAPFDAVCPTCHRPLEGEELQKAKDEHLSELNLNKERVLTAGRANKEEKLGYETKLKNCEDELKLCESSLEDVNEKCKQVLLEIEEKNKLLKEPTEVKENPKIVELNDKVEMFKNKRAQTVADINAANVYIREQIEDKVAQKEPFNKVIADYEYANRNHERLKEMVVIKKDHQRSLASTEQRKELLNLFIKTKLQMLDENVKAVFGNIRFQLIKENINGGYDPICKPYIYDVDKDQSTNVSWKSGSKSERVVTGIAICEKVKAALGLKDLPFLFDEGGEISTDTFNTKFKTNSQLICVKVMDNIKTPMVMKI